MDLVYTLCQKACAILTVSSLNAVLSRSNFINKFILFYTIQYKSIITCRHTQTHMHMFLYTQRHMSGQFCLLILYLVDICQMSSSPLWTYFLNLSAPPGCGVPPAVPNAQQMGNVYTVGSRVRFNCATCFTGSGEIECLAGPPPRWSSPSPVCRRKCNLVFALSFRKSYYLVMRPNLMKSNVNFSEIQCGNERPLNENVNP